MKLATAATAATAAFVIGLLLHLLVSLQHPAYPANDIRFTYTGRWLLDDHGVARADWPCSGVQFGVTTVTKTAAMATTAARTAASTTTARSISSPSTILRLRLNLGRMRVQVKVTKNDVEESAVILEGHSLFDMARNYDIVLENNNKTTTTTNYTVSLTKLTQASPYMNGLGKPLTSVLEFHGVTLMDDASSSSSLAPLLSRSSQHRRRIALIGASDTAGYCVDGTPDMSIFEPGRYDNCDMTSHAVLARRMDAELVGVHAIAGIGMTQNAFADLPFLLGKSTMPEYYTRTLQTERSTRWDFGASPRPDLIVVSLGGNDFNHQRKVPSNETFRTAYHHFLNQITEPYLLSLDQEEGDQQDTAPPPPPVTIVSICGQGDPTEFARDPNNDRCRPCPHVQDATESFRANDDRVRVEYIFIPCDGTVVTGDGDIGCDGHKNRLGQERVADFLEPRLREIMDWPVPNNNNEETTTSSSSDTTVATLAVSFSRSSKSAGPIVELLLSATVLLVLAAVVVARRRRGMIRSEVPSRSSPEQEEEETFLSYYYRRFSSSELVAKEEEGELFA